MTAHGNRVSDLIDRAQRGDREDSTDFTVIEQPTAASIAGVTGTTFALEVSETAAFGDPVCPKNPRCGDIFTDPAHWGPNVFSIGGDEAARMYLASIPYAGVDHLLAISWVVASAADLPAFVEQTQSIVDSIKLPEKFIQNKAASTPGQVFGTCGAPRPRPE